MVEGLIDRMTSRSSFRLSAKADVLRSTSFRIHMGAEDATRVASGGIMKDPSDLGMDQR
jgi:hypothetical protein